MEEAVKKQPCDKGKNMVSSKLLLQLYTAQTTRIRAGIFPSATPGMGQQSADEGVAVHDSAPRKINVAIT